MIIELLVVRINDNAALRWARHTEARNQPQVPDPRPAPDPVDKPVRLWSTTPGRAPVVPKRYDLSIKLRQTVTGSCASLPLSAHDPEDPRVLGGECIFSALGTEHELCLLMQTNCEAFDTSATVESGAIRFNRGIAMGALSDIMPALIGATTGDDDLADEFGMAQIDCDRAIRSCDWAFDGASL